MLKRMSDTPASFQSQFSSVYAIGSLVLGLAGLALSFVLWGAVLAVGGLLMGCWHLLRYSSGRDMAFAGTSIALAALLYCVVFAGVYRKMARESAKDNVPTLRGPELVETGSGLLLSVR